MLLVRAGSSSESPSKLVAATFAVAELRADGAAQLAEAPS